MIQFWQQGDIDIKAYAGQEHEEIYVDTAPVGMEGDGYMQKFCSSEGKKYTLQKELVARICLFHFRGCCDTAAIQARSLFRPKKGRRFGRRHRG